MESKIQKKILDFLKENTYIWAVKIIVANKIGVPDIIGVKNGLFFAIEVKDVNKKPTAIQKYVHTLITNAGGKVLVADNLNDVKKFIGGI